MITDTIFFAAESKRLVEQLPIPGLRVSIPKISLDDQHACWIEFYVYQFWSSYPNISPYRGQIDLSQIFSIHDAVSEVKRHFGLAAEQFKRELCKEPVG